MSDEIIQEVVNSVCAENGMSDKYNKALSVLVKNAMRNSMADSDIERVLEQIKLEDESNV